LFTSLLLKDRIKKSYIKDYLELGFYFKNFQNNVEERYSNSAEDYTFELGKSHLSAIKLIRRYTMMKLGMSTSEASIVFSEDSQFDSSLNIINGLSDLTYLVDYKLKICPNCKLIGVTDLWFPYSIRFDKFESKCLLCSR